MRLPNESRLSCGRNARRRKEWEPQTKKLASEATQFLPNLRAPASFKRLLGSALGPKCYNAQKIRFRPASPSRSMT
jgi:hypothetical protein